MNHHEEEGHLGTGWARAAQHGRLDLIVLDEFGYLPFGRLGGQLLFPLIRKLYEHTSVVVTTNFALTSGRPSLATPR